MTDNAVCWWDFTLYEDLVDERVVIDELEKSCKGWVFQLEKGERNGRIHYQGRLNLKTKARKNSCLKLFKWKDWRISPTYTESVETDFYVTKEETRLKGPWSDKDEKPIYIPRDIREIGHSLLPWQERLIKMIQIYELRKIYVVYDPTGNKGKTIFGRYCMCYGLGQIIPFVNNFKDMMRMVMDMKKDKCYIIDMPRAISKDKLNELYAGIEMIKSGYAYDDRYKFKQELFDPPCVVVFTNQEPDRSLLSEDRWDVYAIASDNLVRYVPNPGKE